MSLKLESYWQQYKEQFKLPAKQHQEKYKWPVLKQVYDKWDWSRTDKAVMFKQAFEVSGSKNLWNSGNFYPVKQANWMFQEFPLETENAFNVLFDESKPIKERVAQFVALFDEKLPALNEMVSEKEVRNHYHGDRRAIALYLTLQYPEKYFLYKFTMNKDFRAKVGAEKPIMGRAENIFNFFELSNEVLDFIKQDQEFIDGYRVFATNENYSDESLHLLTQDFIYSTARYFNLPTVTTSVPMKKTPLNQILFGPPGTGKTYNSINHALSIIEEIPIEEVVKRDRKFNLEKIEGYKELGVLDFVTFHQSFGYEEFIEGIKPILQTEIDEDTGNLEYEIKDGIFKSICTNAESYTEFKDVPKSSHHIDESVFNKKKVFKISLGNTLGTSGEEVYSFCKENKYIAIGWGGEIDYTGVKSRQGVLQKYNEAGYVAKPMDFNISAIDRFALWMKKGDIVFASHGNKMLKAVGVITGDYEYKSNENNPIKGYNHFRKVKWLLIDQRIPVKKVYKKNFSQQSIYEMWDKDLKTDFFTQNEKIQSDKTKNHVIIIDEINRGNVSAIFGELITLIEEDKRIGAKNELKVTLPYSSSEVKFGVPSNLFLIGTMNTADRSVEALDSALRRRFSFKEMLPNPKLLSPSAMISRLFWKHEKVDWPSEPYVSEETELFEFIGVSDELEKQKKDIWEQMKADKDLSKLDYFDKFSFDGINLELLLKAINTRIEVLLDRDHTIGHSYFIDVLSLDDLKTVFIDKIIPLLQEYFYGNYAKMELVIGSSFFEKMDINEVKFAASNTHFSNANSLINISIPSNDDLFEEAVQQLIEGV